MIQYAVNFVSLLDLLHVLLFYRSMLFKHLFSFWHLVHLYKALQSSKASKYPTHSACVLRCAISVRVI